MNFADDPVSVDFTINNSAGVAVDADSLPTGVLVRDGLDTAVVVTIVNKSTGVYNASFTMPSNAVAGNVFQIRMDATVSGDLTKGVIYTEVIGGPFPDMLLTLDFVTSENSGVAQNADSLPVGFIAENAVDLAATVTITNKEAGVYTAQVRVPLDLKNGDEIQVRIEATVNSNLGKDNIYLATMVDPPSSTSDVLLAYADVTFANTYFKRKLYTQPWDEATNAQQEAALQEAALRMDRLNFRGAKAVSTQTLEWPRINTSFSETVVPDDIKIANCEVALALLDGVDPDMEHENLAAVAEGASSMRTTYSRTVVPEHFAAGIPSHLAWLHLRPHVADVRRIKLRRV
jgi:hypothetical protein